MTEEGRRAARTYVHSLGAIAMIGMLAWIIYLGDTQTVKSVAFFLSVILLIREVFHGTENVVSRFKLGLGASGFNLEVDPEKQQQQAQGGQSNGV